MIHDILLSLISSNSDDLPINEFLVSDTVKFLHPGELKSIENILNIGNKYKKILKFIKKYESQSVTRHGNKSIGGDNHPSEEHLHGLYLQAFCDGLELALHDFKKSIQDLEISYLKKPNYSVLLIYQQVSKYQPLFIFLLHLIDGITTQRRHGCSILHFLQQNRLQGNEDFTKAIKILLKSVYNVFLNQLYQWLIYGKLVDTHNEFFIQNVEFKTTSNSSEKHSAVGTITTLSDAGSLNTEVWRYEITYDMLPHFFPPSWANKVLFVGQTVVMFNSPPHDSNKRTEDYLNISLFGGQEAVFIKKFDVLFKSDNIRSVEIEEITEEIKKCVTKHLSDYAINEADLIKQLRLIKDYFLLGRGELYLEFIKNMSGIFQRDITDGTVRDINKAFRTACTSSYVIDDVESFSFTIQRDGLDTNVTTDENRIINCLTLKYKVKWPLHLIFTPRDLENYNEMFRFLLRVKKVQNDLHVVWSHHRDIKLQKDSKILQFRNKLIFLIDNLQYYLQVDVLESEFSILMNSINNTKDFENIQKAHTLFQANILSLCFLISTTDSNATSKSNIFHFSENPIFTILNEILNLIDSFCILCFQPLSSDAKIRQETKICLAEYEKSFIRLMNSLLKLFIGVKAGPSSTPLSQLLLRLDFNYWFSSQVMIKNKIETDALVE